MDAYLNCLYLFTDAIRKFQFDLRQRKTSVHCLQTWVLSFGCLIKNKLGCHLFVEQKNLTNDFTSHTLSLANL